MPAPVCGDDRHLLDYFTAEVLPAITPEQRDLLVRAAPLERLSGSLCDAALQVTGSAEVLAALDRADLFLVALDAEHEWYRCHRLFRDPRPGRRPGCATCCSARRRGSNGTTGSTTRSVTCSELMKRPPRRPLLQSAEAWFFERGAAAGYLMLGELLPRAQVGPQLAIVLAYAAATSGHLDRVSHWLDICDPRIGPGTVVRDWRHPRAAALMIRALIGLPDTESARAVELCGQAVALESDSPGREIALWPVSHSMIINVLTADWSMRWTLSTVPFSVCVSTTSNRARIDSITDCATALIDRHFAVLFKAHVLHRVSSRCPIGTTMNRTGVAAQHPRPEAPGVKAAHDGSCVKKLVGSGSRPSPRVPGPPDQRRPRRHPPVHSSSRPLNWPKATRSSLPWKTVASVRTAARTSASVWMRSKIQSTAIRSTAGMAVASSIPAPSMESANNRSSPHGS